ncbi:MAG TPA: glycosyltransferase [Candidatus Dormibacteraeota bacterium]
MDYFEEYLLREGHTVLRVDHPLDSYTGRFSTLTRNGTPIRRWRRAARGLVGLLWDLWRTVREFGRARIDVAIGANNFDTFSLLVGRALTRRRTPVIYLAADFAEQRFSNPVLNGIYMGVERVAVRHADRIVSNSRRAEARRLQLGLDPQRSLIVPNGVRLARPEFRPKAIDKGHFVFIGSVTKEHGLYELVKALAPDITNLAIIGGGEDWDRVVGYCRSRDIPLTLHEARSHDFVLRFLGDFDGFGLAPYNRHSRWTYYCSPLKVSEYISSGLPVITSSVPEIANLIRERQLGIVYDELDALELAAAIRRFDAHDFHTKAERFYNDYNSDRLHAGILN